MKSTRKLRNVPASILARLKNLPRQRNLDFNTLLDRYAAERFLYRLSTSVEVDRFTLKGAALFRVWTEEELRPTRDVDFLEENSRVKDIWDIVLVARRFDFDGETLRNAINRTFQRRRTALAGTRPLALLPTYYEDTARNQRWQAVRRRIGPVADGPAALMDAGEELRRFRGPVCDSLIEERPFTQAWPPGGPWKSGIPTRAGGHSR